MSEIKVRPLEWTEQTGRNTTWRAESSFGRYLIYMRPDNSWAFEPPFLFGGKVGFKSPNKAKAAAQADYKARILSALSASPAATRGAEDGGEVVAVVMETPTEHIARDIREGRFPARSERQSAPTAPEPAESVIANAAFVLLEALSIWEASYEQGVWDRQVNPARDNLASAVDAAAPPVPAPAPADGEDANNGSGPHTCTACLSATWNDDDLCDVCREEATPPAARSEPAAEMTCDCERSANGLGIAARPCDCQPTALDLKLAAEGDDYAVGEIVPFPGTGKEVSWRRGRMPGIGTKLYAKPAEPASELLNAATDGAMSMLMEVQQECIELRQIVSGFLQCPEIADCAPEDKDPETDALERRARALTPEAPGAQEETL